MYILKCTCTNEMVNFFYIQNVITQEKHTVYGIISYALIKMECNVGCRTRDYITCGPIKEAFNELSLESIACTPCEPSCLRVN
jgi:hypothetical protein